MTQELVSVLRRTPRRPETNITPPGGVRTAALETGLQSVALAASFQPAQTPKTKDLSPSRLCDVAGSCSSLTANVSKCRPLLAELKRGETLVIFGIFPKNLSPIFYVEISPRVVSGNWERWGGLSF